MVLADMKIKMLENYVVSDQHLNLVSLNLSALKAPNYY